jgi:hypothetical protein
VRNSAAPSNMAYSPASLINRGDLVGHLEAINGRNLDPEQQEDIERWQKGREIAHVVNSPGWGVILEILGSYAAKECDRLVNTDPGNKDAVLAAHATAFAAGRIFTLFVEDVQNLVTSSSRVPDSVREGLKHASPVPPESL